MTESPANWYMRNETSLGPVLLASIAGVSPECPLNVPLRAEASKRLAILKDFAPEEVREAHVGDQP